MTTATAPKATQRALHGVTTRPTFKLDKATQTTLDALNHDADQLVGEIDEWRADMDHLYLSAGGMSIDDAIARRAELGRVFDSLHDSYVTLAWEQFALRPRLLPFAKSAEKAKAAEAERVLQTTLEDFSDWGIDSDVNPYGHANPEAANHQLRMRAAQEVPCMATTAAANRAANEVRVLEAQIGVPVSPASCRVTWQPPAGVDAAVLRLLGV